MKSRHLTKKYKHKSRSRSRRRKTRRRVLKGGVRPSSVRPSSRASSVRSISVRPSGGISKPPIPSKCCEQKSVVNQQIISSINNFPQEFGSFYTKIFSVRDDDLPELIENFNK